MRPCTQTRTAPAAGKRRLSPSCARRSVWVRGGAFRWEFSKFAHAYLLVPHRIASLRIPQHYLLPDDEVVAYKALMKDSKQRLGLESFVPWNQVREVLTCYVVHGEDIPAPLDHEYVERVVAFTSKMWGQWCVD